MQNPALKSHLNQAQAVATLLYPHAEVVIHDLTTRKVTNVYNPLTTTNVGDSSKLSINFDGQNVAGPFIATKDHGRKFKSVATIIRDVNGEAIAVQVINMELSIFITAQKALSSFVGEQQQAIVNVNNSWELATENYIQAYLKQHNLNLTTLNKTQKLALIKHLHQNNVLQAKHAASYIGKILDISRASVYKYLALAKANV